MCADKHDVRLRQNLGASRWYSFRHGLKFGFLLRSAEARISPRVPVSGELIQYEQTDRGRKVVVLARIVDLRDQLRRCHSVRMCDFFQAIPEFILEADARLVSVKDDRVSDHRGFHERLPKKCSQVSSGDSVWRGHQRSTVSKKSSSVAVSEESWWCDNTWPARANATEKDCAQHE